MDTRRDYLLRRHKLRTTGSLQVCVAGVELTVIRDASTKTATIVQRGEVSHDLVEGPVGRAAVSTAREFLRLRAERFLGPEWKIIG